MMKFSINIDGEKTYIEYSVGKSIHSGSHNVDERDIILFTELLKVYRSLNKESFDEFDKEVKAKLWIRENTDQAQEIINKL